MIKKWVLLFFLGISFLVHSQNTLSSQSQVSVLTVGPGEDLYSIFGHTAIRIKDDSLNVDVVFNYGTFEFSDDFYVLFAMGKLNYKLDTEPFEVFKDAYIWENRWVKEQLLNLTQSQKQKILDALLINYRPENKYYLYDFFYDNCSTRPRDIIETALGPEVQLVYPQPKPDSSFRDLTDVYLVQQSWGDVGIDLGLGSPSDVLATEKHKTFLPDYLLTSLSLSKIKDANGTWIPLVSAQQEIVPNDPIQTEFDPLSPFMVFFYLLLLYLLVGVILQSSVLLKILDSLLFSVVGLAGWLIIFLWFVTDHNTTQNNFNLLWCFPLLFPFGLLLWVKSQGKTIRRFWIFILALNGLVILTWYLLPQKMNPYYLAFALLLAARYASYLGIWDNTPLGRFKFFSLQKLS
ncbi:MAG: DUF4105 domain-containing protein [Flavobacteriales bacterium]|nr:DUF4105 domain-containing protein [Flavobacteriales bacterium]